MIMSYKNRALKILTDVLGCEEDDLKDKTTLDELGADSLDVTELVMETEVEFDIKITDDDFSKVETIGDFLRLIESKEV